MMFLGRGRICEVIKYRSTKSNENNRIIMFFLLYIYQTLNYYCLLIFPYYSNLTIRNYYQ